MLTFILIVYVVWALIHVYVSWRLVGPLTSRRLRRVLYALFVLFALTSACVFFADHMFGPALALSYRWYAWIYIGSLSTLFALIGARDLVLLALRGIDTFARKRGKTGILPASAERRRFLLKVTGGSAVGVTTALSWAGVRSARRGPEVVEVEVPIAGLPKALDGYHIVQLSDIHVGETIDKDFILPIVETVTSLKPDLVVLTGDLVDGSVDALRADISPLAYLRARDGVLVVTGNHEYYSGVEAWCAHFRELGMSVLLNQHMLVERRGARLLVAGVTDLREGQRVPGHTSIPPKPSKAHRPTIFASCSRTNPRARSWPLSTATRCSSRGTPTAASFFPGICWWAWCSRSARGWPRSAACGST